MVTHSHVSLLPSPTVVPPVVTTSSLSTVFSNGVAAIELLAGTSSTDVVSKMTFLLQAQTDAMAEQAKAVAVQNLPGRGHVILSSFRFTARGQALTHQSNCLRSLANNSSSNGTDWVSWS